MKKFISLFLLIFVMSTCLIVGLVFHKKHRPTPQFTTITFLEGWTFEQMIEAVRKNPYLSHSLEYTSPAHIMTAIGHPGEYPEGRFFPDTYRFIVGSSDKALLKAAYRQMQKQLEKAWQERVPDLPYARPYDALIAASLIEKEARIDSDRVLIAGVIVNRLRQNMPLQMDSSIIYGLGARYMGKLHHADLQVDTPYNTYLHRGLPPTPIAMPRLACITATLHPEVGLNYYFVAKGDGGHYFSTNLSAHNKAVKRYLFSPPKAHTYQSDQGYYLKSSVLKKQWSLQAVSRLTYYGIM